MNNQLLIWLLTFDQAQNQLCIFCGTKSNTQGLDFTYNTALLGFQATVSYMLSLPDFYQIELRLIMAENPYKTSSFSVWSTESNLDRRW